eukprot:m.637526 g.637526  ORF g.637526 m.637526 type:complete len:83 (-) comp22601_c0_seq1:3009-3257(-)
MHKAYPIIGVENIARLPTVVRVDKWLYGYAVSAGPVACLASDHYSFAVEKAVISACTENATASRTITPSKENGIASAANPFP